MEALESLIYVSVARPQLARTDLDTILASAQRNNTAAGITGALLYYGGHFVQVLEGTAAAIDACLARLSKDPRHHTLRTLERRPIARRRFSRWSMRHIPVAHGVDRAVGSFLDHLKSNPTPVEIGQATELMAQLAVRQVPSAAREAG